MDLTTLTTLLVHRGHAKLIQELERQWPGCGAHVKRTQVTGVYDVVWSQLLAPSVSALIGAYVEAWRECLSYSLHVAHEAAAFPGEAVVDSFQRRSKEAGRRSLRRREPATPQGVRRHNAEATARANLERLFDGPDGDES